MSDATVEELVEEAKKPGTFNIVSVLKERAYPSDVVNVYLEEQAAYDAAQIGERIAEIEQLDAESGYNLSEDLAKELADITAKREKLIEVIDANKYQFKITGISEGKRDELLKQSLKKFPMEYDEAISPITGEVTKTEIPSQERNDYFTELLWLEHITSITAPDGAVQEELTIDDVRDIRSALPISATGAITEAIEKIRVSTAVFLMKVDEDFLAKS